MTNNFILSLIFLVVIFIGICKENNGDNLNVATIQVEQKIQQFAGADQNSLVKIWSYFQSLKEVSVHTFYAKELNRHQCINRNCIHRTANGFSIRFCCVNRLLTIIYTVLFLLFLYKFSTPVHIGLNKVNFSEEYRGLAS
jgi:hypothetical protein